MPEQDTSVASETPATDAVVETTTPQGTGETPATDNTTESSSDELKRLNDALKRANAEAKEYRIKAKELDQLKADAEASKLTETEKLQKKLADLQAQHDKAVQDRQESINSSAIQLQALQMGIDPKLANKLIDRSELEHDDNGQPTNVDDVLKQLIKEFDLKPKSVQTAGGATNPSRSASTAPQELSWEVITELQKNPAEYNRRNADGSISKWLYAHPHRYGMK